MGWSCVDHFRMKPILLTSLQEQVITRHQVGRREERVHLGNILLINGRLEPLELMRGVVEVRIEGVMEIVGLVASRGSSRAYPGHVLVTLKLVTLTWSSRAG
jgi:hypothetical protein